MNIGNELKKLTIDSAMTLTELARKIAESKQKHYSVQNLSTKLKKGTVNLIELAIILDELGYNIVFEKK